MLHNGSKEADLEAKDKDTTKPSLLPAPRSGNNHNGFLLAARVSGPEEGPRTGGEELGGLGCMDLQRARLSCSEGGSSSSCPGKQVFADLIEANCRQVRSWSKTARVHRR